MASGIMDCQYASALKSDFGENGYVAIKQFLNAAELEELQRQVDRFIRDVIPTLTPDLVYYEDKTRPDTLKQIQLLNLHDAWFGAMATTGKFPELAAALLDDAVIAKNLQYFNKPPAVGQPTPAHQDGYYFKLDPPEALTMWLALDYVDEHNGCIRYVRGSHRNGMRPHARTDVLGFSQGIVDFGTQSDRDHEVCFPAEPGDLLVHHALTIHRAGGNHSPSRSRRSLGFIYYAECAREDSAAADSYQRQLNAELAAASKI